LEEHLVEHETLGVCTDYKCKIKKWEPVFEMNDVIKDIRTNGQISMAYQKDLTPQNGRYG
jgi:hypothetical protein